MKKPREPKASQEMSITMTAEERKQMQQIIADQDRDYLIKVIVPKIQTKTSKELNLYVPEKWER